MAEDTVESGSRLINTWVQITLGLAIFLWGVYAFFYEKQYVPSHMPPSLVISSVLQNVGQDGSMVAIKGTITTKNTSKTRVWIVSSWYNAYGLHVAPDETEKSDFGKYVERSVGQATPSTVFARHFNLSDPNVVLARKLTDEITYFEPDEEWTEEFELYVPRKKYDAVELYVAFNVAKDERLFGTKWHAGKAEDTSGFLPGELWAETCLKPSESETDLSKCVVLDVEKNPRHKKLQKKYSLLATTSRSVLLLPEPASAKLDKTK